MKRNIRFAAAAAGVAALTAVAGCSSGSSTTPKPSAVPTLTGDCAQYQPYAGHSRSRGTMFGSILSPESDSLNTSWAAFSKCPGIKIQYTGSNTFESDLPVKVNGGNAPNLAIIPQPGLEGV